MSSPAPRNGTIAWRHRFVALLALLTGQLAMGSPAAAACQNLLCMLPDDWLLLNPLGSIEVSSGTLAAAEHTRKDTDDDSAIEIIATMTGSYVHRSDTADEDGYTLRSAGIQWGGARAVTPDLLVGSTLAYEDSRQHANNGMSRTESRLYYAGLAIERRWGAWRTHGAIGFGHGRQRTQRSLTVDGHTAVGKSDVGSYYTTLGWGVSYRVEDGGWYVEPSVSLALFYERTPSYREYGLGGHNQHIRRNENLKAMLAPAVALGRHLESGQNQWFLWISAGVNLLPDNTWKTRSHAVQEPDIELLEVATMPIATGDFRAGVALAGSKRWSLQAEYALQTGVHYRSHSGALRLTLTF
ncbi:MAG: autotransporter domain-containing protein [Pigmentiphaga sp.]